MAGNAAGKSLEGILNEIKDKDIQLVRFEIADMFAISHMKGIPARHFQSKSKKGIPFIMCHLAFDPQGAIAPGSGTGSEVGFGDADFYPDFDTFQILPWQDRTARVLLRAYFKGELLGSYPRNVAERQLEDLKNLGYSLFSAHEHEFYVVEEGTMKPVTSGNKIRSTVRMGEKQAFVDQVRDQLPLVGVDLESIETEYAPGQYEISYKPAFGIRSADNALTYKTSIKEIARQHKLMASFITKPFGNQSGSGAHFNHSLWSADGSRSVMYDENSPTKLSEVAEHWLAGILYHAPAIAVLLSSTVNCLSRLRKNTFAPTHAVWGIDNRTCMVRAKPDGDGSYFEIRLASAASCPYTSIAGVVAAGIDGIKNKYTLPPPCKGNAYDENDIPAKSPTLPFTMESALECFLSDDVIRGAMGEDFVKCFVALKKHEQKLHDEAIASGKDEYEWAREYYFEYV